MVVGEGECRKVKRGEGEVEDKEVGQDCNL